MTNACERAATKEFSQQPCAAADDAYVDRHTDRVWRLTNEVLGGCIAVHKELGPGLLESAYEECLAHELRLRGISFTRQRSLPIEYKGIRLDCSYRLDMVVEDLVVMELKCVNALQPIHDAQVLTYLRVSGYDIGLLVNFNVRVLREGIRRLVRPGARIGHSKPTIATAIVLPAAPK